jgi:hypothetical protein
MSQNVSLGDVIRIAEATKGNKRYIDVRTFYVDKNTE